MYYIFTIKLELEIMTVKNHKNIKLALIIILSIIASLAFTLKGIPIKGNIDYINLLFAFVFMFIFPIIAFLNKDRIK